MKPVLMVVALMAFLAAPFPAAEGAVAETAGCVTHGEYDTLEWGLSADQVQNRFDTNGWLIATGDDFFRRGYEPCWDSTRKVVVWYDLALGLSDHWDVRDR